MSSKRTDLDILTEMLQIIKSGVTSPTKIMYMVNTSYDPGTRRLMFMEDKGLIMNINKDKLRKAFVVTEKGLRILEVYETLQDYLEC